MNLGSVSARDYATGVALPTCLYFAMLALAHETEDTGLFVEAEAFGKARTRFTGRQRYVQDCYARVLQDRRIHPEGDVERLWLRDQFFSDWHDWRPTS